MFKKMMVSALAISAITLLRAFDNTPGWKKDADGKLALDGDGNPIYVQADGKEMTVEAGTIGRLNGEARSHRERAEKAEAEAAKYKGIDPDAAKKALDTVSKLDTKKLIDAGEVDRVRSEIGQQYQQQITEAQGTNAALQQRINNMMIDGAFASSKFIQERVAVPPEMFRSVFGQNFKVEGDKVVPYGFDGNIVNSPKRIGEIASIDEAFEVMVANYPYKEQILKANTGAGSGNQGNGGSRGGNRSITRGDFERLSPVQQAETAKLAGTGQITITD